MNVIVFYVAAVIAIITTVLVITRKNATHALLYLAVSLGLVGTQMISMGLLGEVMMRTYYESQDKRPLPFRFGYYDKKNQNHLIIMRRKK